MLLPRQRPPFRGLRERAARHRPHLRAADRVGRVHATAAPGRLGLPTRTDRMRYDFRLAARLHRCRGRRVRPALERADAHVGRAARALQGDRRRRSPAVERSPRPAPTQVAPTSQLRPVLPQVVGADGVVEIDLGPRGKVPDGRGRHLGHLPGSRCARAALTDSHFSTRSSRPGCEARCQQVDVATRRRLPRVTTTYCARMPMSGCSEPGIGSNLTVSTASSGSSAMIEARLNGRDRLCSGMRRPAALFAEGSA